MNYFAAWFGVTTIVLTTAVPSVAVAMNAVTASIQTPAANDRLIAQATAPFELEDVDFWTEQCRVLMQQQDYASAIAACERAITLAPRKDNLELWLARGDALFQLQRYAEAIVSYNQVLQVTPNNSFALTQQCAASFRLGQYDTAIDACENALSVNGNWETQSPALAWYNRGLALRAVGRTAEALDSYDRAMQVSPEPNPLVVAERCQLIAETNYAVPQPSGLNPACTLGETIRSYDLALANNPNNAIVWVNQGMALERSGQYERALSAYNQAAQINPTSSQALAHQCRLLNRARQYQAALTACENALQGDSIWRDETPAFVWSQRSRALIGLSQYEVALAAAEQALALDAKLAEAWNYKAVSLWSIANSKPIGDREADYAKALEAAHTAVTLKPGYSQAWFNKGSIHSSLGGLYSLLAEETRSHAHYEQASQAYCQALDQVSSYCTATKGQVNTAERQVDAIDNLTRANVLVNLSAALWHLGFFDRAAAAAENAVRLNPQSFAGWYNQGVALSDLAPTLLKSSLVWKRAEDAYQQADRLSPNNIYVLAGLGRTMVGQGRTQAAVSCFERALNLDPNFEFAQSRLGTLLNPPQPASSTGVGPQSLGNSSTQNGATAQTSSSCPAQ